MATKKYTAPKAPAWWLGNKTGKLEQDIPNAVLPYLSPEDQAKLRSQLALTGTGFGAYAKTPGSLNTPQSITSDVRSSYLSQQRAQLAARALQNMAATYGKAPEKMGAGYNFLSDALSLLAKYGGVGTAMNRQNYSNFVAESNALLQGASKQKTLAPYLGVAAMFLNPTFSAGALTPTKKSASGSYIFGTPNSSLYA